MRVTIARTSSPKMLVAIALLVLAAVGALWVAAGTGGVAEAATATAPVEIDGGAAVAASTESDEVAGGSNLPTFEAVALGRDPFDTVRPPSPPSSESTEPTSTSTSSPASGSSAESTSETQSSDTDVCRSNGESVCEGVVVVLLEIQESAAVIQVNGESYLVAEGEEFHGGTFQLLRLNASGCAEIVYRNGDVSDVFTQCPGGSALK